MTHSRRLPDWSAARGARILQRFSSGPVVDSWLVELSNKRCVLRLDRPLARDLGLDRANELQVLNVVADTGIAPQVIAANPSLGYLLLEYVPGVSMQPRDLQRLEHLQAVAGLLAKLHRLSMSNRLRKACADLSHIKSVGLMEAAKRYAQLAQHAATEGILREIAGELGKLEAGRADAVVCHHDCHPGNFLLSKNRAPRLIDWEYAAFGNLHFDLAVFLHGAQLDSSGVDNFLNAYASAGGTVDRRILKHWRKIQGCLNRLWVLAVKQRRSTEI